MPDEDGASSNTLEYAYDDYVASQFAQALGKTDDQAYFAKRALSYKNQFDPQTGYMRRRKRDGSWVTPVNIHKFGTVGDWNSSGWMEGTAWIYSFFIPQNVPELVRMVGQDRFNQRLEEGFAKGYVDLSNQPNLQAPFLFNYSGKPRLTQKYTRYVLNKFYNNSPLSGWVGEEDEGQLSSFYVLLAMGLFEMDGGTAVRPTYDLSSPLFSRVVLHLDKKYYGGHTFTIEAKDNSETNVYIQSATLNGQPLDRPLLAHADLVKGGKLVLQMGPQPNKSWG
ncbi:MAG: glycoside hydrolase domain-containing protein [Hymenobacter sp.]